MCMSVDVVVGPFQSDALLVPEHCVFDHVHNSRLCSSYGHWNRTALQSCSARGHQLQNFAILQPCGVDKFNGVEFVCCPRDKGNLLFAVLRSISDTYNILIQRKYHVSSVLTNIRRCISTFGVYQYHESLIDHK